MPVSAPDEPSRRHHSFPKAIVLFIASSLHKPFISGVMLLIAAVVALILANSHFSDFYEIFWNKPICLNWNGFTFCPNMHFVINDVLMTLFFLVTGVEIRSEMHDGALSNIKQASLPIMAAIGGVCFPAIIYSVFNYASTAFYGWAVPTATDIAFAVGILSLLGSRIPNNLRIILLSLAVIDDIIAVIIIALFYSGHLNTYGIFIGFVGILLIVSLQRLKISSFLPYLFSGVIVWAGLFILGVHPSLTGIILGLLTPVLPCQKSKTKISNKFADAPDIEKHKRSKPNALAKTIDKASTPVEKTPASEIKRKLAPWVTFLVMPLFALANAGVNFSGVNFSAPHTTTIIMGVIVGLVVGKPIGIITISLLSVKIGLCRLPNKVDLSGMILVGLLAGIGFTMAIFTAMLAFPDIQNLEAAKIGVLSGSLISACIGLAYGLFYLLMSNRSNKQRQK